MQAVILAAGAGTRLNGSNHGKPKCLLAVDGEALIRRQARLIRESFPAVECVVAVVGFRHDLVRQIEAADDYVLNSQFATTNTAASLAMALSYRPADTLLINGDVVCDAQSFNELKNHRCAAACEFKADVNEEEVQVITAEDGSISRIGKNIGGSAEAVGIYRLCSTMVSRYLAAYSTADAHRYYEDVFDRLIRDHACHMTATTLGCGWAIEVDTPDDWSKAQRVLATAKPADCTRNS